MTSILLIEDSRTDAMLIKSCLKLSPIACTFVLVERLADAEVELKRQFDVAIVDLNLPDSSGMETVRRVRELRSDLPIVVFSGDADDEKGVLAMREGAQDFILKQDFNRSTLERSVRFAIERHQRQVLSQQLLERDDTRFEQFVEVFLAVVDLESGQIGYVGAGHGAVLIRQNGEAVELGATGLPTGMTADLMMDKPGSFQMEPGDLLAVYTDGLYECRNQNNQILGQDTVISLLKNNRTVPLNELINRLIEVSCNFCEPDTPPDDITIAMVRYVGQEGT